MNCIVKVCFVAALCLTVLRYCGAASFLKKLEEKANEDLVLSKRHALLGNLAILNNTALFMSSSLSGSYSSEQLYPRNAVAGVGWADEKRRKRHAIIAGLQRSHPMVITINGTNYTIYGSSSMSLSMSSSMSGSGEYMVANDTHIVYLRRPYGVFGALRKARDVASTLGKGRRDVMAEEKRGHGRKRRHVLNMPIGQRLLGKYNLINGSRIFFGSSSLSSSMESGEYRLLATPASTSTPKTTTSTPSLNDKCCENTTCISYQNIYDSCRASNIDDKTCMASLVEICERFKKTVVG